MIRVDKKGLTFEKKISDRSLPGKGGWPTPVDHEELAKHIAQRGFDCASILVVCEHLRDGLCSDSKYMKVDNEIGQSELQKDATRELQGKYPTMDEVKKIIKRYKIPTRRNNYEPDDRKFYYELENKIYQIFDHMLYPSLIFEKKQNFQEEFYEKRPKAKKEDLQKAWRDELIDYLMPSIERTHTRVYDMPEPLNSWDSKDMWKQWYFVNYGDEIRYVYGSSAGSSTRESHGRWAHVFSMLEKKYHTSVPLYCFKYTGDNSFAFVRKYECFKAVRNDLNLNYPVDKSITNKLLKNRLLSIDYKTYEIKDVQG